MATKRIKLIWDFRGPDAKEIAKHHVVHLEEFASKESLDYFQADVESVTELYSLAFITVQEGDMKVYRNALRPHRGLYV